MLKTLIALVIGVGMGAGGVYLLFHAPQVPQKAPVVVAPAAVACESEVARQRVVIEELEKRVAAQEQQVAQDTPAVQTSPVSQSRDQSAASADRAISWKVSAIEKFVVLSPDQKDRLRAKYQEERDAQASGRESSAETLEAIIGEEGAATYQQQVKAAFERVQNEELDKEAVWISHKLSLSPEQERSMRNVFNDVEAQIDQEFGDASSGVARSGQERVMRMVAENKKRIQLRSDALKKVLTPEQYATYAQVEAQSATADMEVFHDTGDAE